MQSTYTLTTSSEEETLNTGFIIGKLVKEGTIIALSGELGSGKTVLTKGIARGLGIEREPNSPTFVIVNIYEGRIQLNHFDLYRINSVEELDDIGFGELTGGTAVSVIEWADKIADILPEDTITVEIYHGDGENNNFTQFRKLIIKGNKEWVSLFKNTVERA